VKLLDDENYNRAGSIAEEDMEEDEDEEDGPQVDDE
jgi:hypothetical protein